MVRVGEVECSWLPVSNKLRPPRDGNLMGRSVTEAASRAAVPALVGYVLTRFQAPQAWAFFGHACGILCARLVINLADRYNTPISKRVEALCLQAEKFLADNPKTPLIGLLAAMALAWASWVAAAVLGVSVGLLSTFATREVMCAQQQEGHDGSLVSVGQYDLAGLLGFRL